MYMLFQKIFFQMLYFLIVKLTNRIISWLAGLSSIVCVLYENGTCNVQIQEEQYLLLSNLIFCQYLFK